jgi:hypothetical protein
MTFRAYALSLTIVFAATAPPLAYGKSVKKDACAEAHAKIKNTDLKSYEAEESACNNLVQPACEDYVDSAGLPPGGDADLLLMACALRANYFGNVASGNGLATPGCKKAIVHIYTMNTGVAEDAAGICLAETKNVCESKSSTLEKAKCRARAAATSYVAARNSRHSTLPADVEKAAKQESDNEERQLMDQFNKGGNGEPAR